MASIEEATDANGVNDYNPFRYLRPAMRSEEDDIRKGVFSQALRNLAACSLDVRRRWCATIQEVSMNKRSGAAGASAKKAASHDCPDGVANVSHNAASADHQQQQQLQPAGSSTAEVRHSSGSNKNAKDSNTSNDDAVILPGHSAEAQTGAAIESVPPSMVVVATTVSQDRTPSAARDSEVVIAGTTSQTKQHEQQHTQHEHKGKGDEGRLLPCTRASEAIQVVPTPLVIYPQATPLNTAAEVVASATAITTEFAAVPSVCAESEFDRMTSVEANEYIAKYMRSLLDRVVGGSLNNLSAPALRVLCVMLHIDTRVRSKDALYNILASYYYTHCEKLGKRISRSTFVDSQAYHDAKLMEGIAGKSGASSPATGLGSSSSCRRQQQQQRHDVHEDAENRLGPRGDKKPRVGQSRLADARGRSKVEDKVAVVETDKIGHAAAAAAQHTRTNPLRSNIAPNTVHSAACDSRARAVARQQAKSISSGAGTAPIRKQACPAGSGDVAAHRYAQQRLRQEESETEKDLHDDGENEEEGEIVYPTHVFSRRPQSTYSAFASAPSQNTHAEDDVGDDEEWTSAALERQVASIVQLYDPVTTAIVVKKLAQIGYRSPGALDTVEGILHRFHQRQLILYDNGIAYLM